MGEISSCGPASLRLTPCTCPVGQPCLAWPPAPPTAPCVQWVRSRSSADRALLQLLAGGDVQLELSEGSGGGVSGGAEGAEPLRAHAFVLASASSVLRGVLEGCGRPAGPIKVRSCSTAREAHGPCCAGGPTVRPPSTGPRLQSTVPCLAPMHACARWRGGARRGSPSCGRSTRAVRRGGHRAWGWGCHAITVRISNHNRFPYYRSGPPISPSIKSAFPSSSALPSALPSGLPSGLPSVAAFLSVLMGVGPLIVQEGTHE
jgi:hypothetical protein